MYLIDFLEGLSGSGLYLHCGSEPHLYDNHIAGGERGAGADQSPLIGPE